LVINLNTDKNAIDVKFYLTKKIGLTITTIAQV